MNIVGDSLALGVAPYLKVEGVYAANSRTIKDALGTAPRAPSVVILGTNDMGSMLPAQEIKTAALKLDSELGGAVWALPPAMPFPRDAEVRSILTAAIPAPRLLPPPPGPLARASDDVHLTPAAYELWARYIRGALPLATGELSPELAREIENVAERRGMRPEWLAGVIWYESKFEPAAQNLFTRATGLIQFMPDTADRLGTSVDALSRMTAVEQMGFVDEFFRRLPRARSAGGLYLLVFYPEFFAAPPDTIIFAEGSKGYSQNKGLDRNSDGLITVGDVLDQGEVVARRFTPWFSPAAQKSSGKWLFLVIPAAVAGWLYARS